ncbi:hypothetical protein [uncultured Jatrophihabitans sp.]|uniref:hypothetical protein n=1 Tax=uncultured Jatrophihabitans sp. TaxID=1610747 RepID=UPI0035CA4654
MIAVALIVLALVAGSLALLRAVVRPGGKSFDRHVTDALAIQDDHELVTSMANHPSGKEFTAEDRAWADEIGGAL